MKTAVIYSILSGQILRTVSCHCPVLQCGVGEAFLYVDDRIDERCYCVFQGELVAVDQQITLDERIFAAISKINAITQAFIYRKYSKEKQANMLAKLATNSASKSERTDIEAAFSWINRVVNESNIYTKLVSESTCLKSVGVFFNDFLGVIGIL